MPVADGALRWPALRINRLVPSQVDSGAQRSEMVSVFLHFVTPSADTYSHRKQGLLTYAHDLCDEGDLSPADYRELRSKLQWFNEHLRTPAILMDDGTERALSWFKPGPEKPPGRMWVLAWWLDAREHPFELLEAVDPGQPIYEDKWQVVARPPRGVRLPS